MCCKLSFAPGVVLDSLAEHCSLLEVLSLQDCYSVADEQLLNLLRCVSKLRELPVLELHGTSNIWEECDFGDDCSLHTGSELHLVENIFQRRGSVWTHEVERIMAKEYAQSVEAYTRHHVIMRMDKTYCSPHVRQDCCGLGNCKFRWSGKPKGHVCLKLQAAGG
jgi:hypothetical protein